MTLHQHTDRELKISMVGNTINVETKKDLVKKSLRKEQLKLMKHSLVLLFMGVALGIVSTLYIIN